MSSQSITYFSYQSTDGHCRLTEGPCTVEGNRNAEWTIYQDGDASSNPETGLPTEEWEMYLIPSGGVGSKCTEGSENKAFANNLNACLERAILNEAKYFSWRPSNSLCYTSNDCTITPTVNDWGVYCQGCSTITLAVQSGPGDVGFIGSNPLMATGVIAAGACLIASLVGVVVYLIKNTGKVKKAVPAAQTTQSVNQNNEDDVESPRRKDKGDPMVAF
jgi:hypothetical protein